MPSLRDPLQSSKISKFSSNNQLELLKTIFKPLVLTNTLFYLPLKYSWSPSIFHWSSCINRPLKVILIHFEAIKLALSYHSRKGLPVVARLALLDTRYLEYSYSCIESLETILNTSTVILTFYPKFHVSSKFTIVVLSQGTIVNYRCAISLEHSSGHSSIYRVQNYASDLALPINNEALLIFVDSNRPTTCIHVQGRFPKKNY